MPFLNSAIAGTQLVRPAIRSPNYVGGSSGWSVNRDGTCEFTNGTFRGAVAATTVAGAVITGSTIQTAPPGNQRIVIDPSGNGTIYFYPPPGGTGLSVTLATAIVGSTTPVATSGTFTPAVGETLLVIGSGGSSNYNSDTIAITDSQVGSWTQQKFANLSAPGGGGGACVGIWTRTVAASSSMTVTATVSGSNVNASGIAVYRLAGTSISFGASGVGASTSVNLNPTAYTSTVNGSTMFVGTSEWSGSATLSSGDLNFTSYSNSHQEGGAGYKVCGNSGAAQTFQESTSKGSAIWYWVALEVSASIGNDYSYINAPSQNTVGVNSGNGGTSFFTRVWAQPSKLIEGYYTTAGVEAGGVAQYDNTAAQFKYLSGGVTGGYLILQNDHAGLSYLNGGVLATYSTKVTADEPNGSHFEVNNGNASMSAAGGGSLNLDGGTVNVGPTTAGTVNVGKAAGATNLFSATINLNNITGSTGTTLVMSSRQLFFLTSSSRFKVGIQAPQDITMTDILQLQPMTYFDQHQVDENGGSTDGLNRCLGLIAEDTATMTLGSYLVNYEDGQPFSISPYAVGVLALMGVQMIANQLGMT